MPSPVQKQPMELRLPRLAETTDELIDLVAAVSPVVKANKNTYMQGPGRYGEWLLWAHVPELCDVLFRVGGELYGLVAGAGVGLSPEDNVELLGDEEAKQSPDFERWVLMMVWLHMHHLSNEYARTVVVDILTEDTSITRDQLLYLDQPDSDMWTEEQSLVLKFVKAAFEWEMTTELFEAVIEKWGAKPALNALSLCAYYYGLSLLLSTVGADRYVGLTPEKPLREQTGWPGRDPSVPVPS